MKASDQINRVGNSITIVAARVHCHNACRCHMFPSSFFQSGTLVWIWYAWLALIRVLSRSETNQRPDEDTSVNSEQWTFVIYSTCWSITVVCYVIIEYSKCPLYLSDSWFNYPSSLIRCVLCYFLSVSIIVEKRYGL